MANSKYYLQVHEWLRKNYGNPQICESKKCKKISIRYDWALKRGYFHAKNRNNYKRLCRSCHVIYDWSGERTKRFMQNVLTEEAIKKRIETQRTNPHKHSEKTKQILSKMQMKPILQKTLNGELIKRWYSMKDIESELGIPFGTISACARGKQSATRGFKWEYANK